MGNEDFVVKGQIKAYFKGRGFNVSSDTVARVNSVVEDVLDDAMYRADSNNRKTVMARDV